MGAWGGGILAVFLAGLLGAAEADPWAAVRLNSTFVEVTASARIRLDQRYATTNNFLGRVLYPGQPGMFLHKDAYAKLTKAAAFLQQERPGWSLLLFDGLRPRSVQRELWAKVKGTPQAPYVTDPDKGSVHNYGMAVDLSLADEKGKEADMGTPYDNFTELAQPRHEARLLKEGRLTLARFANRAVLRGVMLKAGYVSISNEWWHFDALPQKQVREQYQIVE